MAFPLVECTNERPDDHCGCRRSFCGLDTAKATTTAVVAELDIDETELTRRIADSARRRFGEELAKYAEKEAKQALRIAGRFEVGEVLERRGNKILSRGGVKHAPQTV